MTTDSIKIYTDGAARGNPGRGGYGAILMWNQHRKEISEGYRHTTNNRMELMAVIKALELLKTSAMPVQIYSDSQYVVKAVKEGWLNTWIKTNFRGDKKNPDLWKEYHKLSRSFNISMFWVKGHASNPYNNRCDELATTAADGKNLLTDHWYEQNVSGIQ
ncbi:MAG: ribonuclease HI [Chitinophagaceae bacterium]|nr:MAG: ribonuclease HI [Chitinophagaceae bacterium]